MTQPRPPMEEANDWIWQISEYTTDSAQLERIKKMFKNYTLDDAVSYEIGKSATFERNGSFHTLHYENDLLVRAEIIAP